MAMKTIGDCLVAHKMIRGDIFRGDYGIEVETEAKKAYDYPQLKFWQCVADGSLRNFGVEYIMKVPMPFEEVPIALEEIDFCNKKFKFLDSTVSTSVHVHINMLTETPLAFANFVTTYALVESLLIRISGPDRKSNLFCLPLKDAEGNVENIENVLRAFGANVYKKIQLDPNRCKYSSLNIAPLSSKGSIEIRTFRGETNTDLVYDWVKIIHDIRQFSRQNINPKNIIDMFDRWGPEIINEIFPNTVHLVRNDLTLDQVRELLFENLYNASKFAVIKDKWDDTFGLPKPRKVYREKLTVILNDYALNIFNIPYADLDKSQINVIYERYLRDNPNVRIIDADGDL